MRMNFRYVAVFLLVASFALFFFWPGGSRSRQSASGAVPVKPGSAENPSQQAQRETEANGIERMREKLRMDYSMPIDFWGKVIDHSGNPIAGVKAEVTVEELTGRKPHVVFSDENGRFELLGKRGSKIRVTVSREGYAATADDKIGANISSRMIYYSMKGMPAYTPPTRDNPQIFMLRKKNPPAKLAHAAQRTISLDTIGSPNIAKLEADGKSVEIVVRCWSSCPVPFTYDKYDWRAEVQVVGGKLRPITEFDPVTAPTEGFQELFRVEMPKDLEQGWKATNIGQRDFWIQFDDDTYAKSRVEVKTGRVHEVDAEVWFNLDGTNNFER